MRRVGAFTVTEPVTRACPPCATLQSKTTTAPSVRFSRAVTEAVTSAPTPMTPSKRRYWATMRVPGPGRRRLSSIESSASAPTAWVVAGPGCSLPPEPMCQDSTSPDTSAMTPTSVSVTGRETLTVLPTSISSKVTLRRGVMIRFLLVVPASRAARHLRRRTPRWCPEHAQDGVDARRVFGRQLPRAHPLVGEQPPDQCEQPFPIGRVGEELRECVKRALRLIVHDDVLLAPDAPHLLSRQRREELRIVLGEIALELEA